MADVTMTFTLFPSPETGKYKAVLAKPNGDSITRDYDTPVQAVEDFLAHVSKAWENTVNILAGDA